MCCTFLCVGRVFVLECDRCRRGNNTGAVCAGTRVQRCAIIYYVSQTFARRLKHCRYNGYSGYIARRLCFMDRDRTIFI